MIKNILLFTLATLMFSGCLPDSSDDTTAVVTSLPTTQNSTPKSGECNTDVISATNPITRPMLVVLLSYNDIQIDSSISTWNSKIFGKNQSQLNHYYDEISTSKFEFAQATECNGVASVHLDKNHPNISIDSSSFDALVHPDLKAALTALDGQISFDIYDTNSDGHITPSELLVTFIIAGYEDAYEGRHVNHGIWAHQSCVASSNTPTLDGVTIMGCTNDGNFALFGEKHDIVTPHNASIGIIAHELGHSAFSLPDLYSTTDSSRGGIGYFGLMGGGTWAQKSASEYPGDTPVHMTAWSKIFTGWVTPDETSGSKVMNATSLNSYNTVKIQINSNEYYLLENRDNSGYDQGLKILDGDFNGGIAIWHINNNKITPYNLENNIINTDTSNKGVDLVEAANANIDGGGIGDEKNLFYDTNVDAFSQGGVSNISARGSAMTLDVN